MGKRLSREAWERESRYQLASQLFKNVTEGVLMTDAATQIVYANPACLATTGYALEELLGKQPAILHSGRHNRLFYQQMWQSLQTTDRWQGEIWNRRKNGEVYPEWLSISLVRDSQGGLSNYLALFSDITLRKDQEERLCYSATHDALTQLPNRKLLTDCLLSTISDAEQQKKLVAVLFVDLDYFKAVNDNLGHIIGDWVLQMVAKRLLACVRVKDTVGRLGGDEFLILLQQIDTTKAATAVARKILKALSQPFILEGKSIVIGCSIGISFYPDNGNDIEGLLKQADQAMYQAKKQGRNGYYLCK